MDTPKQYRVITELLVPLQKLVVSHYCSRDNVFESQDMEKNQTDTDLKPLTDYTCSTRRPYNHQHVGSTTWMEGIWGEKRYTNRGEIEGQRKIWRGENEGELEQNIFMTYLHKILPKMNIKSHFQTPKYSITYLCN